jgi:multidrug resistance efflux pump
MGDDVNSTQLLPEPIHTAAFENDSPAKPKRNIVARLRHNPFFLAGLVLVLVVGGFFGIRYWLDVQSKIYIENSEISAPIISMSPVTPGIIDSVFVKEGDAVTEGQQLAQVGNQFILAKTSGIVIWVQNTPGQMASGATVILKMIDPNSLRVIGHIEEDKGLSQVQVGQNVDFTADAFSSKQYQGVVESVAPTSNDSKIVFSISDQRQEKLFDVTIKYDVNAYPELKNGMSAKMWIHK